MKLTSANKTSQFTHALLGLRAPPLAGGGRIPPPQSLLTNEAVEPFSATSHTGVSGTSVASFAKEREEACPYPQVDFSDKMLVEVLNFLDDELYDHLRCEARRYTQWSGRKAQEPSIAELKAILFLSGHHGVPSRRGFWSLDPDLQVRIRRPQRTAL